MMTRQNAPFHATLAVAAFAVMLTACGGSDSGEQTLQGGSVQIDGSSTVYPISEAVAEEFGIAHGGAVRITIGLSGTGGGFKRFCTGETEISNASRHIADAERELCAQNGVEFLELPVAIDGLAVVAHPDNSFVQCLTVAELRSIWEPGSQINNWSQVREGFPNQPLKLYGPGTNSGTFDYFTEALMGEAGASRGDFTASEDDNVLVQGVQNDVNALGYFGYAYYIENEESLRALGVDNGDGCVTPDPEAVKSGRYAPLSRPLFIYVNRADLERPEVAQFVRFYLENAAALVPEVGYVPLEAAEYEASISQIGPAGGAS
ncbi:PstS family phosphate ABC transporter substrate-binding protein [soil metagenome]